MNAMPKPAPFTGLSAGICLEAWDAIQPLIERLSQRGRVDKFEGTMIVVDPRIIDRPKADHLAGIFNSAVIFAGFVGDVENPEYTQYARHKAFASWRSGHSGSSLVHQYPHALGRGDTIWEGSYVDAVGTIYAFSGFEQPAHDEAVSETMAVWVRSISRDEMTKPDGVLANWEHDGDFLGGDPALGDYQPD